MQNVCQTENLLDRTAQHDCAQDRSGIAGDRSPGQHGIGDLFGRECLRCVEGPWTSFLRRMLTVGIQDERINPGGLNRILPQPTKGILEGSYAFVKLGIIDPAVAERR